MNVLIIGGSSDIGTSLAKYLKKIGYNTIITYNNNNPNLFDIESLRCNVLDELEIEKTIKYVLDKYKRIDILINMAAISMDNYYLDKTKEEFMNVLEVNLVGPFLTSKVYSKYVEDGLIINISSTDGIDTFSKYNLDYSVSKAGLIHLSKNMAICTNNKIICICPNWIDSLTTRSMDKDYLESELKRINQSRLITINELNESIYKILNMQVDTGSIFRIDIKDDDLWIEKI